MAWRQDYVILKDYKAGPACRLRETQSLNVLPPIASGTPLPLFNNSSLLKSVSWRRSMDNEGRSLTLKRTSRNSADVSRLQDVPERHVSA